MEPTKIIIVKNLFTGEENEIKIGVDQKVKDLKITIEKLYNIKIENNSCIYKRMSSRGLTCLPNEDKSIKEAHIKNYDMIILGKQSI